MLEGAKPEHEMYSSVGAELDSAYASVLSRAFGA